ncbi:MAG: hypothetical protein LBT62_04130 [Deltaproteobacteria bacterium]|nr:hypothetical protein [Deltaproteobacteria bacterium]
MFFRKKNPFVFKALEVEQRFNENPLAVVEVDRQTAEFMGAFQEDAVTLDDFPNAEPGALDWFFTGTDGSKEGARRRSLGVLKESGKKDGKYGKVQ